MSLYQLLLIKRRIENFVIRIFAGIGRDVAAKSMMTDEFEIYFFFPFYHTGGAEKVHALLTHVFRKKKCVIFFTKRSHNEGFKQLFQSSGHKVLDISAYTDNKFQYWKNLTWRGVISYRINNQKNPPIVFNGQCNFAYKLSPWINKNIAQVELIHSFNSFSYIRLPFIPFVSRTVMISRKAISDHEKQYERFDVPGFYLKNIVYILNGIVLPRQPVSKPQNTSVLKVLYAGRATAEKRADLAAKIARDIRAKTQQVSFGFAGDILPHIDDSYKDAGQFYGNVNDEQSMSDLYTEYDVLLVTSTEEGFPMVIMEAMAHGCIVLATPVGDIPHHIKNGVNGFVFSTSTDENKIIKEAGENISTLLADELLRKKISASNQAYASENFSIERFSKDYHLLFASLNAGH